MKYKSDYKIYKLRPQSRPRIPTLPIKKGEVKRRYDLFSNALINVNRAFFQAINLMFYLKQLLGALQPLVQRNIPSLENSPSSKLLYFVATTRHHQILTRNLHHTSLLHLLPKLVTVQLSPQSANDEIKPNQSHQ